MSFSLHRRGGYTYGYALIRTPDLDHPGQLRQHLKSTKTANKETAKGKARELEEAALSEPAAGDQR